jgi:adenylate cyclase
VQSPAIAGEPVIYVEPVTAVGDPTPDVPGASMIRERMFNALARFDDVTVVSDPPRDGPAASPSASKFAGKSAPNYRLSTAVNYFPDGAVMEAVRLIDAADGTIAWSKSYDHKGDPNPNRPRGRISSDVAQTLLQQFGVIQAREASKRTNADPMQDSYRCILDTNAYQRSFNPSLYGPARDCLEHATAESRPLDGVFVKLARLYVSDYQFGGAGGPAGNRAALDRAYQMAVRAVDIKPTSAVAQYAMEQVLLARRDFEHAKVAGENALSLNPYDNAVIFGHAARLILTGQIDEGMAALRQNTNKKTAVWTGHHFLLALGSYLKDDLATAEMEVSQISNENFPPGLMLDALVAAHNKNRLRARHDIEVLYAKYPSWRDDARANIGYFLPGRDMADRIGNEFDTIALDLKKHPDVAGNVKPAEHP